MKILRLLIFFSLAIALFSFTDWENSGSKVVPSHLAEFTVYSKEDHIKVTWVTHERQNIKRFEIQRSRDGKRFESFKVLDDGGSGPNTMEFFEVDNKPLPGWSYYRILELIETGDSAYSGIAPVFYGLDRMKKGEVIAARNPLDGMVSIQLDDFDGEQILFVLRDAGGTEYYVNQTLVVKGGRLSVKAGSEVPQGIYVITAASKDELVGLEIFADL